MDEGDEDREAGIGDEEDEGSDLDIGDDTTDTGKLHVMKKSSNSSISDEYPDKFCFVFCVFRGESWPIHSSLCPPSVLSVGPRAAGQGEINIMWAQEQMKIMV